MLTVRFPGSSRTCDGRTRRDFLRVGALGLGSLTLPDLLKARAEQRQHGMATRDTSVIWLWLGGGPTHVETFDPKMSAPAEFRSMVGDVQTSVPGVRIGRLFPRMGRMAHKMAFVRSFAHTNSGHGGATHWVMTGYDYPPADSGLPQVRPSLGSIVARQRGPSHPGSGLPTYVRLGGVGADGPSFLGVPYAPFDMGGQARANMNLVTTYDRLGDRRRMLAAFDTMRRDIDTSGLANGMDQFATQGLDLLVGRARVAFDVEQEQVRLRDRYGPGIGERLLLARRLCEAGAGVVTLSYSNSSQGWDMHNDMKPQLEQACPPLDRAVSTLLEDLESRGMSDKILLVITGEFGRTPRINSSGGRDHWGPLSTLALAGGGLRMGQVVGESSARAEVPRTRQVSPQDLMATAFHVLGFPLGLQFPNQTGRPMFMVESGRPIPELV